MIAARHYAAFSALCLAVLTACGQGTRSGGRLAPALIPAPATLERSAGSFRIAAGTPVYAAGPEASAVARRFVDLVSQTRGVALALAPPKPGAGAIRFVLDPASALGDEAYALDVAAEEITVRASRPAGLFYGAVTLWQLATADGAGGGPANIPGLRIADAPRFRWRGLMLDSARHYQPPGYIRSLVDWMALHKLNVLHWHLTDDQGWRIEIRKYPRLTGIGAWRRPALAPGARAADPATGQPPRYGGYYSQDEVRALVAYAAERFVTIVPEIEMPGHAQAAIASYPALGTDGAPPPVSPDWGVHDYLFNADESTLAFLEDVLDEVLELFPGEFIHIGGDEAVKDRWMASPRVQARIRELGLADEEALQGWFVARIERFLDARGRRLIGWDEILETGIPPRAAIMSWRGTAGGIAAARAGHDVVMSPAPDLYLDYLQGDGADEPPGRPSGVTLESVYAYEPVPHGLAPDEAAHILGAQLNAWTEHMRLPERVTHQAFPRAAALAEVTWSPAGARDWTDFRSRLGVQFARYRRLGLAAADSAFEPRLELAAGVAAGTLRVAISNQAAYGEIRYTIDGSEPGPDSLLYRGAFEVPEGARLRAATFDGRLPLSAERSLTLDGALLRTRTGEALGQCSGKLLLRLEDDAPPDGERALYNVDIVDPCWIWKDANLMRARRLTVAVGQLPFNFQIGRDADSIRRGDARTPDGELEVRIGACAGEPVAIQPLSAAAGNPGVSVLPPVALPPQPAPVELCLRFARSAIDPIWAIQWARLDD